MGVKVRERAGKWWIYIDHRGRRVAHSCGSGKVGKRAAEKAAEQIAARLALGDESVLERKAPPESVPTFKAVAEAWGPWYQGLYPTRFNTRRNNDVAVRAHLVPHFGAWPIASVTRGEIQKFIAAKRGKLADSSLRIYLVTLRLVLDFAVERGDIAANPMRGGKLWRPEQKGYEPDPFTQAELSAMIAAAEDLSPAFALMMRIWAQSGMRSGELRGLRRSDLDQGAGMVLVQRTLTHGKFGPPKTLRSKRTASVTYPVCEAIPDWNPGATPDSRSVLDRLAKVVPLNPDAPLFGSIADPGQPMQESELWRWWGRVLTLAKVRPRTPETLRHTFVSLMLSRGAPLLLVASQAGHSAGVMLKYYSRWLPQAAASPATPATPAQQTVEAVGGVVPATPYEDAPKLAAGGATRNFSL